jgi:cytochrome c biogenesis protein CcdA/thiol-disulfide isomerase/thioredoxin
MNPIEIILSFLEGVALIASPCILPVLPLVFSASLDGGRKRPFGIIIGFVLAFTAFALLARKLVMISGIDSEIIRNISLVLLALFGLILLSEVMSAKFSNATQRFANAGGSLLNNNKDGFFSGVLIGALIGIVWTPCAGPILAAVLVQVIRQESDLSAFFLIASFALGAGMPMLIISITGRRFMSKIKFFNIHAKKIRKCFGVLILLAVGLIASGINPQSFWQGSGVVTQANAEESTLYNELDNPYPAPEIAGIEAWLNSNPLTLESLKGKVVLIDFWTYSCINCVRTLPYITKWDRTYRDKGLVIIGIHSPEFEFEKNKNNVESAIAKHNIEYPVALDNRFDTWKAFKNRYWPAHYLINKDGKVVYTHFGEGKYVETENNIRHLLGLDGEFADDEASAPYSEYQSPETYLGNARASNFVSPQGIKLGVAQNYTIHNFIPLNNWALSGEWIFHSEHVTAEKSGSSLFYNFNAKKVFLVLGTKSGKPIKATVKLNGESIGDAAGSGAPDGILTIDNHTIYEIVNQDAVKNGLLEIITNDAGLEAYAFTFGS